MTAGPSLIWVTEASTPNDARVCSITRARRSLSRAELSPCAPSESSVTGGSCHPSLEWRHSPAGVSMSIWICVDGLAPSGSGSGSGAGVPSGSVASASDGSGGPAMSSMTEDSSCSETAPRTRRNGARATRPMNRGAPRRQSHATALPAAKGAERSTAAAVRGQSSA